MSMYKIIHAFVHALYRQLELSNTKILLVGTLFYAIISRIIFVVTYCTPVLIIIIKIRSRLFPQLKFLPKSHI